MNFEIVKQLLDKATQEELLNIIARLTDDNEEGEKWLLNYCATKNTSSKEDLIKQGQIHHYWNVAQGIVAEANEYGGTHAEDEANEAFVKMIDLTNQVTMDWKLRKPIIDQMMKEFLIGNSGFEDLLSEASLALCDTEEEFQYVIQMLKQGDEYYAVNADTLMFEYKDKKVN